MKRLLVLLVVVGAMVLTSAVVVNAQSQKERQEALKQRKDELNKKSSKAARNEAKKFVKEGWLVSPGALPLDKQLDRSYLMQLEWDESGLYPKYFMSEAMSIGENYDAAKLQALELAKQNLAGQIQTEVIALIENTVANKQLAAEQAASITESVMASKNLISQSIGRVIPVVEAYRTKSDKNKEVLVRIAYNSQVAMEKAKKAIRQDLEEKGKDLHEQLDAVLGVE
ncbi:MAG: hypothetical protein LBP72_05630 [Dysgonamonadaceae bacterium]|jgi:hypothetical protein|nr:hypothetical protein [Dysgonamonadaceae bacterium]